MRTDDASLPKYHSRARYCLSAREHRGIDLVVTACEYISLDLKQGIQFINNGTALGVGQPATMGITPPGTTGYSQVFLVEVQYQDVDGGALVLPYYNAANPQTPFPGPGGVGTAQNTVRYGGVAYQIKAGIAAATGRSRPDPRCWLVWTLQHHSCEWRHDRYRGERHHLFRRAISGDQR